LESLAAGPAIARQAREKIEAGVKSVLSEMVSGQLDLLSAKDVVTAARSGDDVACQVMQRAAYYFGLGLVSIVTTFDPEKVVVGGGVSNAGDLLLTPARAVLQERAMTQEWRHMTIQLAELGEDVGLLGAAALVLAEADGSTFGHN
jgi:predicted NBD/HSP70 family sugar kinase